MTDIRAQLSSQIELEDEARSLGQSRYHLRELSWKAEAGAADEDANLPPGQHLLKAVIEPTAKAISAFLSEACARTAGRSHRAVDFLLLTDDGGGLSDVARHDQ